MAQAEKSLLLKDLCARLPYGVIVDIKYNKEHSSSDRLRICSDGCLTLNTDLIGLCIEEEIHLKPYLRPMSNMTEEERRTYDNLACDFNGISMANSIDWLNENMFDYRGLIPMGLALKVSKEIYNTN